jgi:hypothetical protein
VTRNTHCPTRGGVAGGLSGAPSGRRSRAGPSRRGEASAALDRAALPRGRIGRRSPPSASARRETGAPRHPSCHSGVGSETYGAGRSMEALWKRQGAAARQTTRYPPRPKWRICRRSGSERSRPQPTGTSHTGEVVGSSPAAPIDPLGCFFSSSIAHSSPCMLHSPCLVQGFDAQGYRSALPRCQGATIESCHSRSERRSRTLEYESWVKGPVSLHA